MRLLNIVLMFCILGFANIVRSQNHFPISTYGKELNYFSGANLSRDFQSGLKSVFKVDFQKLHFVGDIKSVLEESCRDNSSNPMFAHLKLKQIDEKYLEG